MKHDERVTETVIRLLAEVLPGGAELTPDASLKDSGLDSISAVRVWFEIQREFSLDFPVERLGGCATPAELAARIAELAGTAEHDAPVTVAEISPAPGDRHEPFPLTPLQQAYVMGADEDATPDPVGCQVYREFEVPGVDPDRLRAAWQRVVDHHDALRLQLGEDGTQRILDRAPSWDLPVDQPGARERLAHRRYEPGVWPPFAVEVTTPGTVHFGIDASVTDGRGLDVLLRDWWRCYRDPGHTLEESGLSVRDCLLALDAQRRGPRHQEDLDYWRERLADLPPGPAAGVPDGSPRSALTGSLTAAQWGALRARAAELDVSPTALVLTLFAETVGRGEDCSLAVTTTGRAWLPREVDEVVGPFTGTAVFAAESTLGEPLPEAVQEVHRRLWRDLGHAGVPGVTVMRELRERTALPVVFTSLLDARPDEAVPPVTYALSQTSGVALDHQMWEHDGELRVRWDLVPGCFAPGEPQTLFARFTNALRALAADTGEEEIRPLNELQKAYYVARAGGSHPYDGCQVHHSFHVRDLDRDRLERAWLRLVAAHDALRSEVTHDGTLRVRPHAPENWSIPDIPGAETGETAGETAAEMAGEMAGRAFPLGRWPHWELRVSGETVHAAVDLAVLDGRSIHIVLRELFRLYADPSAEPRPPAEAPGAPERPHEEGYWAERFRDLPPGPEVATTPARRVRLSGSVAAVSDETVFAALAGALRARFANPFSVSVVRWTAESEPRRPGEHTALSWVTDAESYPDRIAADAANGALTGLATLRGHVMKERRRRAYAFPVVYTSTLDLTDHPLPDGVEAGPWMTYTPDVALDCIVIREGDRLHYHWDALEPEFPDLAELFAAFEDRLRPAHRLFERQAAARPDAVALRHAGGTMTYGELNRRANAVAWRLKELDVGPGTVVAVRLCRGPDMVAAVLGIHKAGGAYLPVEPSLPDERAAVMLDDAAAGIVLTCAQTPGWAVPEGVRAVELDAGGDDRGDPPLAGTVDDLAYVIFTSGSTGKPKGVEVSHRPLLNLLDWCYRTFDFDASDVGLCVTSLGFDLSVFDIFGLLGRGASLYIADEGQQRDPELLLDVLIDEPITFWNSAPTTLNQLAPLLAERQGEEGTGDLRLVFLSGDYTPLPLPDAVRATFPRARVVSLGGATEATVWSNWFEVGEVDPSWRSIPYGRPIDDALYYILDEDRRPCPEGVEGDLFIGGRCLSLGYRNQPELTAERFVPDPFAGGRMYLTGDRAALLPDGNITFLGRADNQVKIRGFRVELGEIEHRLRQHPGVRDVVVLARDDRSGERKLVAYVMAEGAEPDVGELRAHAAGTLPAYMVPNHVAFVSTFPATANGKLDRDALPWPLTDRAPEPEPEPEPEPAPEPEPEPEVAGRTVTEIAELFAELIGVEEVDPGQDLWDQGVTSFTMVQVSKALRKRYGRRVPVALLLENPTVTGIAAVVGAPADTPAPKKPAAEKPSTAKPAAEQTVEKPVEKPAEQPVEAGVEADGPGEVDFFSPEDREAFKAAQWNLRPLEPDASLIRLDRLDVPEEHFAWRASVRDFAPGPLPYRSLCRLLGLLRERRLGDRARHLYPSAGDTYAVQAYLHVTKGAISGVAEGIYYYNPVEHALHLVNGRPELDRTAHFVYNRDPYDRAAFSLYLIGQTKGIEPLYGEQSLRYLTLEAGYLGQLLMTGQAACGIGLCPIGEVAFDQVRDQFDLDDGHRFLQAFLGGPAEYATGDAVPVFATPVLSTPQTEPALHAEPARSGEPAPEERPAGLAVIGMAGRYPGADDLDGFWRNLSTGARSLGPSPRGERPGGYLEHIDRFDSLLFHVSPKEAATLDPQLRLLLHSVWECLEHAGHTPDSLHATAPRVGVFVGSMWHDYQHAGAAAWRAGGPAVVSATASDMVNRVSYFFGFTGPSIAVDTSCSSTLTALHLAAQAIRTGDCDAAVVAGVNLLADPYHAGLLAGLGLLAEEAGAAAFDPDRPGWTVGEGVGTFLLRPVADAVRAGDAVHGVVEATWVAHTGRTGRFTAPSADAMAASMRRALERAGAGPGDVSYVECAAAGAALADAAEAEALAEVFGERSEPVAAGTLKPNIGHLEAASGASQLAKVLLQLRHGRLAPTLLAEPPTDAVTVPEQPRPWTGERRALINAFGATGTHAHAVVRAPLPEETPDSAAEDGQEHAVLVSAATEERLVTAARRLAGAGERDVRRIAYTTQTGRAALAHRLAVVCRDAAGLREGLEAFAAGRTHLSVLTGRSGGRPTGAEAEAAAAWVAGQDVDWARFWPEPPGRVALPSYPFEAEPYWIERAEPVVAEAAAGDMEDYLKGVYAEVSGIDADRLGTRVPLEQYGLTSSQIVELNARLERDLGERSRTLFFEHKDLAGVAAALSARTSAPPPADRPDRTGPRSAGSADPADDGAIDVVGNTDTADDGAIAVIGIAGRYPDAPDLGTFWENLAAGRHSLSRVPADRTRDGWPVDLMWGGFLDGVTDFDPLLFGITPRDAALMDPQERVFLEVTWEALEDAGYPRTRLRDRHGSNVAVYAGVMYNEYPFFGVEQSLRGTPQDTGATLGGVANRVSYHLDLKGPSMSVDTMCSSSLAALHLAVRSLRQGECELAIAGGVNLNLHPNKFVQHARMRLTAGDRRCHSFGAGGDGFVPAEGAGVVLLKPLSRAKADGDRIHAVIRGTAVVHSGRTNGWVVPSPVEEGELVARALADAGVDPAGIGYLECHGAGTALGDPIEINALMRVFGQTGAAPGSIPIGSVKSNLGHVESGAGIAGLTKIVLQLRHRRLVPSLHADELNPDIAWDEIPFRVQREAADWPEGPDGAPRRAGLSSFGAGGTIAHAVIEEAPPTAPTATGTSDAGPQLIVLSAHDERRLRAMAGRLAGHLRATPESLADVAHTLRIGREPLRERLALVVADVAELCERLERFARSEPADVLRGRTRPGVPPSGWSGDQLSGRPGDLLELGRHWVDGGHVDWTPPPGARLVGLPSYPFDRMRCWPFEPASGDPEPAAAGREPAFGGREPAAAEIPLFERIWAPAGQPAHDPGTLGDGTVVCLFGDASEELARSLGDQVVPVGPGDPVPEEFTGWIDLRDLGEADPEGELDRLAVLRDALARRRPLRILHVTSGLLDLGGPSPSLAGARMAGFVRMLAAEYPAVTATVLDSDRPTAAQIRAEWAAAEPYGEVCYRDGERFRPDLRELSAPYAEPQLDPAAVYVVSGGTRGLGALVARHLAEHGARRLALLGVRPLPPRDQWDGSGEEAVATVLDLERAGARVVVHTGPPSGVPAFLDGVRRELGPIGGVVHCAGRSSQGRPSLAHKSQDDLRAVLVPKADLLEALDEACAGDRPAFFVTFSSVCAAVPALAAGVADYAAANAFLDYCTGVRRRSGRTEFRSVDWPQWRESGGARGKPNVAETVGLASLTDRDGLRVLDRVIGLPRGATVLPCPPSGASVDVPALIRLPERADRHPAPAPPAPEPARGAEGPDWLALLFSETIGIPVDALDPTAEFGDLGVESVMLAELVQRIEERLGESLEPSLLLDYPTLEQLRDRLGVPEPTADRVDAPEPAADRPDAPEPTASRPDAPASALPGVAEDRRIAIIGMACRFPGAPDVAAFWRNLTEGRCDVREVPVSRWDHRELYSPEPALGRSISKWGGFVDGIEDFDNDYFDLGEDEARALDPAIRMFLECCAACLADAGYDPAELRGRRAGVFAGARMSDYGRRVGVRPGGLASDQNFIAARVAHHFDLRGPNLVVDSACSSSLVGVQLAAQSLLAGEAEVALAGGVEVLLDENDYLQLSAAKALSPTGRCHTFDERADGFVPGEGCGVVLLKPLRAALADGDRVHAVIEAVAVNNDGRTMGVTTPNPEAQADVVRRALAAAGRTPREIGLIEAHGTGTLIGDPIELRALTRVFAEGGGDPGTCAIGSVKSNIGHTLSAAGIAGLIKAALAVEHGLIPPTLSCERPNPRFDFAASPFEPVTEPRDWPSPRVAGVSSFGLGGTNAHLVLSEPPPRSGARPEREPAPAPVFRRRRLWLDRDPAPARDPAREPARDPARDPVPAGAAGPGHGPDPGPPDDASSLLDLNITTGRR
ncbi:amino acid adenylation domain-containing protein [Nonomuraea sp. NPDC049624]|uniref:amino acid adenylation domain-containing protein n=2 Tax=unclassified Nonomuraea TaxID=2593643 RepID=UPI0034174732